MRLLLPIFVFAVAFGNLNGQDNTGNARLKSQFIYGFTKHVSWSNMAQLSSFKIGVLGEDSVFYNELKRLASSKNFQGKPFEVVMFKSIEDLSRVQILYLHKRFGFDISRILNKTKGYHTLVVSENYPFKASMINFIQISGKQQFEMNLDLLDQEGFDVSEELKNQAVKSGQEWQELYFDAEKDLKLAKERVKSREQELQAMESLQLKLKNEIEKANTEINKKIKQLNSLQKERQERETDVAEKESLLENQKTSLIEQELKLLDQDRRVKQQNKVLQRQLEQISKQESKIDDQKDILEQQLSDLKTQKLFLYLSIAFVLLFAGFGVVVYRNNLIRQKINAMLEEKNNAIEKQKTLIESKNRAITSSINYAKKIQQAILTPSEYLDHVLPEYFVYSRPKDIVSGDFYWAYEAKEEAKVYFAVVDCTGHGVPGAFMSLVGNTLLNEIIIENKIKKPHDILEMMRHGVIEALKQKTVNMGTKDGMDMALCVWDKNKNTIEFSGAHNPIYLVRNGVLSEYKGDPANISYEVGTHKTFSLHEFKLEKNDCIYLFSDGFVDQKGGEKKKKFYYKPFRELISDMYPMPMAEQKKKINEVFNQWKGDLLQMDDVCIMGIRF